MYNGIVLINFDVIKLEGTQTFLFKKKIIRKSNENIAKRESFAFLHYNTLDE